MQTVFWIGVYPELTKPILDFVIEAIASFVSSRQKEPFRVL